MNRKYIRLRRILGISTILLGLLIAILPMFGQAAVTLRIIRDDYTYFEPGAIKATLENGVDGDGMVIASDGTDFNSYVLMDILAAYGEVDSIVGATISIVNENDEIIETTDRGRLDISMYFPLELDSSDQKIMVIEDLGGEDYNTVTVDDSGSSEAYRYISFGIQAVRPGRKRLGFVRFKPETAPSPTEKEPTAVPTSTPTPVLIPTNTPIPTPTPIPVRIPSIDDQRSDRSDTRGISGFVYGGSVPNSILIIRDSDGVGIKKIVVLRKGMILKPWYIRLVDENRRDVTDFKKLTITLPVPANMNLNRGRVVMLGKRKNGRLHAFETKIVTKNGFKCAEFTTDYFSDYEYGMLYTPDDAGEEDNTLIISDERGDQEGSGHISGSVTEGSGKRTLHIADSDGVVIRRRIFMKDDMLLKPYRIWITDEDGNNVDEFGTLSVTLPLPEEMDPEKGSIRIVGSTADKAADDFVPEIIKNDDGTYSVRFATDYFSDNEYGIVYTPFSSESDPTDTPTPIPNATATPTQGSTATPTESPTPYANITATPTTKDPKPTKEQNIIVTAAATATATPTPFGGYNGGVGGDGGSGGGSGDNNRGRTPIVTPKGGMFYENGLSMNYAKTGSNGNGGKTANYNGNNVKGGSNVKDMPKTGMADVPRMLLVIVLITLGCIQLITTIPVKKN